MTETETEHDWFVRQIPSALADGLSDAEKSRFEAHGASCPKCSAALSEAKNVEQNLSQLLSGLQPDAGLEERIVNRLSDAAGPMAFRMPVHSYRLMRRALTAAAAAVLVCGTGYVWLQSTSVRPAIQIAALKVAQNNLRQIGQAVALTDELEARRQISQNLVEQNPSSLATTPAIDSLNSSAAPGGNVGNIGPNTLSSESAAAGAPAAIPVLNQADTAGKPAYSLVSTGLGGGGFGGGGGGFGSAAGSATFGTALEGQANANEPSAQTPESTPPVTPMGTALVDRDQSAAPPPTEAAKALDTTDMPTAPAAPATPPPADSSALADRKIIRSGEMDFQVENFDSAYVRLHDIVHECGGFIGATESERLPNGKVRGTVTVRLPPENLDTLVLKLRALGDLQSQNVTAQDVTREYIDLESQLRAAKAMEDRLIDLIKTGRGQIKELLAAENELGTWREKDEQLTGQINYYNNLVSLSTLSITMVEKDIGQAATATQTQTVNAGLEADDVSHVRDAITSAIDAAKGRILQSELNENDPGQFTATIVAAIPPDTSGAVLDRLAQLGRITRMESHINQSVNGQTAPPGLRVERSDTMLNLSIYNVAACPARVTDDLSLACDDVDRSYHALLDFVTKSTGGRIVSSSLTRPTPDTSNGVVAFEVSEPIAPAALDFLQNSGTVLQLNVTENPDSANVTSSKRAFTVRLKLISSIAPRETDEITLLPQDGDLQAAFDAILDYAAHADSGVRVLDKGLEQQNGEFSAASIDLEVSRPKLADFERALDSAGSIVARKVTRQPDSADTVDSKVLYRFSFVDVSALPPRQTMDRQIAVADVADGYQTLLNVARAAGANVRTAQLNDSDPRQITADLEFVTPAKDQSAIQVAIDKAGNSIGGSIARLPSGDSATDLKTGFRLRLIQADQLPPHRTYQLELQTSTPMDALAQLIASAQSAGARVVDQSTNQQSDGTTDSQLIVELPLAGADSLAQEACSKGTVHTDQSNDDTTAPSGPAARGRLEIHFVSAAPVVADDNGLAATIKQGLITSIRGLLWSVQLAVIGLCLIGPWALILWGAWKIARRKEQ